MRGPAEKACLIGLNLHLPDQHDCRTHFFLCNIYDTPWYFMEHMFEINRYFFLNHISEFYSFIYFLILDILICRFKRVWISL